MLIICSEEGSQISDVTNEKCDRMVENLVYILVNINESPSDLQHFFSQSLVFELEAKGFSVIKYMAGIIKEIDEDVLTKMIDLSFQEELDNYKMFSILFKLLKESEETDIVKSDDESRRSSDSASQTNLLTSISSKKNIIVRALVLAIYKSFSRVYEIQMISRIFFMMFLPYVFCDNKAKDDILIYLEEADEDEDIERILTRAIDIDNMQNRELKRVEERKSNSLPKNKEMKHISTQLIEELNILIGSDLIPLKQMIQFAVKVVILLIPDNLSRDNDRDSDVSLKVSDWHDHYLRQDIAKHENLEKIISRLPGIKLTSILSYLPDFEWYDILHEMLVFSVKLSFAGDEINQKEEWERILNEIWSSMCHRHTIHKIYCFWLFVKYKIQNKVFLNSNL